MDKNVKDRYRKRFKDHKATVLLENEDFLILDWRNYDGSRKESI